MVSNIFYFQPYLGKIPIWLIFFKGVETTNQMGFHFHPKQKMVDFILYQSALVPFKGTYRSTIPPPKLKKTGGCPWVHEKSAKKHGPYENLPFFSCSNRISANVWAFHFMFHLSEAFSELKSTSEPVVLYNPFWCMFNSKLAGLHSQPLLPKQITWYLLMVQKSLEKPPPGMVYII